MLVVSHITSLQLFGRPRGIIVVVDTGPILFDISTVPPTPPSPNTVCMGRGRRCLDGVCVVCGRYIHYGGKAPRTPGQERRNIMPRILADTETFHRKYCVCTSYRKRPSPLAAHHAH